MSSKFNYQELHANKLLKPKVNILVNSDPNRAKTGLNIVASVTLAITLVGCAAKGTDGVVPIGNGNYMIGGIGGLTDYSASAVKARYFKQAAEFCATKGQNMQPLNSAGVDSGPGTYASAEIQFRCIPK